MAQPDSAGGFEEAKRSFFAGLDCHQTGRFAEAERHYLASLAVLPGRASTLVNLAAAQLRLDRPADALATADRALAAEPDGADALFHRGTALLALRRLDDALQAFDRLLKVDPQFTEGWLRRAQTLQRLGRPDEALAAFDRVLVLEPTHGPAWSGRGGLLRELSRLGEAAEAFRQALQHGGDPALHAYYLAAVGEQPPPATAPALYVQSLFDAYADDFDQHLVGQLGYQAPRQLVDTLAGAGAGPYASALDLGCGTGLCGPLVRPMAVRLTGLDLSAAMLDKAAETGAYDRLEQADAVTFLDRTDDRFDLVLAADVFIYIGELDPLFAAVRRVMPHGVFCFSVEELSTECGEAAEFRLTPSLRYAHSQAGLRRLAARHRFEVVACKAAPIRQDQRETVPGLFVCLRVQSQEPVAPGDVEPG